MNMNKSVERSQELLERVKRKWSRGGPIFREAAQFREEAASFLAGQCPSTDWFSELLASPVFRTSARLRGGTDLQSTLMTWMTLKLREVSDTSNWFRPTEALAYKLVATDLRGAVCGDLKMPMPAFYIELPADMFYIEDRTTGWHQVRALVVGRGTITEKTLEIARTHGDPGTAEVEKGPRLLIECYAEPNEDSKDPFDDSWLFMSYRLPSDTTAVDDAIKASIRDVWKEAKLHRGRLGQRVLNGIEVREFLMKFVLNFCVYLGSEKATVEHVHLEEISRLTGGKKRKQLRKTVQERIKRLENDRVFVAGTEVSIEPELREYVRTEGTGGFALTYRTLVRGHWRNQAHGPQFSLRTRKWIEPHVRGAELPTKTVGHTYEVK